MQLCTNTDNALTPWNNVVFSTYVANTEKVSMYITSSPRTVSKGKAIIL